MQSLQLLSLREQGIREAYLDFLLSRQAKLPSPETIKIFKRIVGDFLPYLKSERVFQPYSIRGLHIRGFLVMELT